MTVLFCLVFGSGSLWFSAPTILLRLVVVPLVLIVGSRGSCGTVLVSAVVIVVVVQRRSSSESSSRRRSSWGRRGGSRIKTSDSS